MNIDSILQWAVIIITLWQQRRALARSISILADRVERMHMDHRKVKRRLSRIMPKNTAKKIKLDPKPEGPPEESGPSDWDLFYAGAISKRVLDRRLRPTGLKPRFL